MNADRITPGMWDVVAQMLKQGDMAWEKGHVDRNALELEALGILQGYDAGDEIDFMFTAAGEHFAEQCLPAEYR
jgi:hypothetical protein